MNSSDHNSIRTILKQDEQRKASLTNGNGPWTIIYDSWSEPSMNDGGYFVTFADPSYRSRALENSGWDLLVGDGMPCFSETYVGGTPITEYERNGFQEGIEPLLLVQNFNGLVPDSYLISQEFVLLMNLWKEPHTDNYYVINNDGSKEPAIQYTNKQIRIRTPLLRRYQAARQLDLLLFMQSTVYVSTKEKNESFSDLDEEDHIIDGSSVISLTTGSIDITGPDRLFSMLRVKRVLTPPPQETCGIWPWGQKTDEYPKFIIGEDRNGQPIKFTCDPEKLANYFGKNPTAPHYLTPVFFKPDVLQRYYDKPEIYSVEDGRLSCAGLWSVQIDNGNTNAVVVFLGDIGRDIPDSERTHWLTYNIPPTGRMSKANFQRSFLGIPAETQNPELLFKNAYRTLNEKWHKNWGWDLYRKPSGSDTQIIKRVHIPLNDSDTEFESQLLNMAKLLVDLLNERDIAKDLQKVPNEKGISKLERFLRKANYANTNRDISLLRRIQELRSHIAAHTLGSSGHALLLKELGNSGKSKFMERLFVQSTQMLIDLSELMP